MYNLYDIHLRTGQVVQFYFGKPYNGIIRLIKDHNLIVLVDANKDLNSESLGEYLEYVVVKDQKPYKCTSKLLQVVSHAAKLMLVLEMPNKFQLIERRKFYRLTFDKPLAVNYLILDSANEFEYIKKDLKSAGLMRTAYALNISGGGIKIRTKSYIPVGKYTLVKIDLPPVVVLLCRALRSDYIVRERSYDTAFQFENISESERESIIKYVFELSRKKYKEKLI